MIDGNTVVWSIEIDHGTFKKTEHGTYSFTIELNLESYKTVDYLVLKLGAHGSGGDDWQFNNFEMHVYFIDVTV